MNRKLYICVFALTAFLAVSGCRKDNLPDKEAERDVYMDLTVCVDDLRISTKLTDAQETAIESIVVLVFEKNAAGKYLFSYVPEIVARTDDNLVRLKLQNNEAVIRVAIFANAGLVETDGELYLDGVKVVSKGEDIDTAFDDLTFECPESTVKDGWAAKAFPMWWQMAASEALEIKPGDEVHYGKVLMLRAVAKMCLTNDCPDFELEETYLYNCPKTGLVASPVEDGVSLPASLEKHGLVVVSPDAIYLPEAAKPSEPDEGRNMYPCHPDATCLVVGGKYKGGPEVTYYRIDVVEDGSTSHLASTNYTDIVRSHIYDIVIRKVNSEGAESPEDALGNRADIGGIITAWASGTDSEMTVE